MQEHESAHRFVFEFSSTGTMQRNWQRVLAVTTRSWNVVSACHTRRRLVHPILRWTW